MEIRKRFLREGKIVVTYRLLNSENAFNEVVGEAKRRGINQIVVNAGEYYDYHGGSGSNIRIYRVSSDPPSDFWINHPHPYFGPVFYEAMRQSAAEQKRLEKAIKLAKKFSSLGFKVTIEGESIEIAEVEVKIYEDVIQEGIEKWGPFPRSV